MNVVVQWTPKKLKVSDIKKSKKNYRHASPLELKKLKESIIKGGYAIPMVVNHENEIINGNHRLDILNELKIKNVWVMTPNRKLTDNEEREFGIRFNREAAKWDKQLLAQDVEVKLLLEYGFNVNELIMTTQDSLIFEEPSEPRNANRSKIQHTCPKCGHKWQPKP